MCAVPSVPGEVGLVQVWGYVKAPPADGAAPAWAPPDTVCADYAHDEREGEDGPDENSHARKDAIIRSWP